MRPDGDDDGLIYGGEVSDGKKIGEGRRCPRRLHDRNWKSLNPGLYIVYGLSEKGMRPIGLERWEKHADYRDVKDP
ncbi:unnamed protein product [Linum tenue]|uniref:Uncharacterized protein n=1 Tax=Linum tenue TaxID=586396 RepID=A0AAV0GWX1_9ROSI|nr:unnamed protein product [Linum tenue]